MPDDFRVQSIENVPEWLPDGMRRYLAHTAFGQPIRDLARHAGCHASTVLRQVRKFEALRDDALVDAALAQLEADPAACTFDSREACQRLMTDALRALNIPRSLLVYHAELDRPAILRSDAEGASKHVMVVEPVIAAMMILRGWLAFDGGRAVKKYKITSDGRAAVPHMVADQETRATGLDAGPGGDTPKSAPALVRAAVSQAHWPESPLSSLSRRRDTKGNPFLPRDFIRAGERLLEDFEMSELRSAELLGWDHPEALDAVARRSAKRLSGAKADAANRVLDALRDLGPGLSDVALRCCCLREGLEATEKRLGWSARSGKVVLRIALQRLNMHYGHGAQQHAMLIG